LLTACNRGLATIPTRLIMWNPPGVLRHST